ncbi:MAG: hypothetical protein ACRC7N_03220 [Clostridium sp.]
MNENDELKNILLEIYKNKRMIKNQEQRSKTLEKLSKNIVEYNKIISRNEIYKLKSQSMFLKRGEILEIQKELISYGIESTNFNIVKEALDSIDILYKQNIFEDKCRYE